MTREETRRENARRLAHDAGGHTEFGRLVGMERSQVSQLIGKTPKKNIGNSIARRIELAFHRPEGWLDVEHPEVGANDHLESNPSSVPFLSGVSRVNVGEKSTDTIPIKLVTMQLQAGIMGFEMHQDFEDGGTLDIPARWIEQNEFVPHCLFAIKIKGESMQPLLYEGDVAVVNIADTKKVSGGVYAINFNGEAVVKRLKYEGREWYMTSENGDPQYARRLCRGGDCIIVGRIVRFEARNFKDRL